MSETPPVPPLDDDDDELPDDNADLVADDKNPQVAALKREAIRRRKQVKALKAEAADLRAKLAEASTPKDGVVTLEGDDAKAWTAYRALNLAPDAIATGMRELGEMKAHQRISVAAQAVGWKPGPLGVLIRAEGLRVEMREVGEGDDKRSVPHVVTGEGESATAEPLAAYVETRHPEFLAALVSEPEKRPTVTKLVTPYPSQAAASDKRRGLSPEELAQERRRRGDVPVI